jgi:secreted trypsin-like serine protease
MFQVSNSGSNSECGISERTRIVGGTEATPGEWPWAVIVGKPKESSFQVESKYILNLN